MANNPDAVARGRRLYDQTCQACHGGEARGDRGPSLTGSFSHGNEDGDLFRNIRNGIAGSGMPAFASLTADQVWQLTSYLRSLNGTAASPNESASGDPAVGETIFFGKASCSACHQVNGRGGIVGPDLSGSRKSSAEALRQKIVDPNAGTRRGPAVVVVKTSDGREVRGIRRAEDTYSLQLVEPSGNLLLLDKARITEERYEFKSLMPDDYSKRLTAAEIQNVVAYLKTLDGRDFAKTTQADLSGGLSYDRLRNSAAEPQNWLTYWGDYQGRHYSALKQINTSNVRQLQARWSA
jgi:putative heme-binding domain-containing protein